MDINECYPSKFLSAADLKGQDLRLTIREVSIENVAAAGQKEENKPVVYFTEETRGLALNKTNATSIAEQLGPETSGWANKAIVLFPTQVDFQGKQVPAIRIKLAGGVSSPPAAATAPPPAASAPPPPAAAGPPAPPPATPPAASATTKDEAWQAFKAWHDRQNASKPDSFTNEQLVAGWNSAIDDVGKPEVDFTAQDWTWMAGPGVATLAIPF